MSAMLNTCQKESANIGRSKLPVVFCEDLQSSAGNALMWQTN